MSGQLNVLMISPKPTRGVIGRPYAMAKKLVEHGHKITLMMVSEKEHFRTEVYNWDSIRAVVTPHLLPGRLSFGWDPYETIQRLHFLMRDHEEFDLIHSFETRPAVIYPALWISKKKNIPLITDWNDWFGKGGLTKYNRPWWYHLMKLAVIETYYEEAFRAKAAGLTVISTFLGYRAIDLGVQSERIIHIPGGVYLDKYLNRSKDECRLRMGLPLGIPILGFSSKDSHFDLDIVMKALAIVASTYPDIRLIVTGKARKSVYKLTKESGVRNYVNFLGYVSYDDLPWYLGCADIFLLPMANKNYNLGRWPNKMVEYMSLGRPTVANPVGDIEILFKKHEVGYLANRQPEDFAEKIISLLKDPTKACELGQNARKVAETEYDWDLLTNRLESFYFKILDMEKKSPMNIIK